MRILPTSPAALLVALAAVLALAATPALAAGAPPAVTVRVEGVEGQTLLPQTEVQTTSTPVPVEGGSCPGTSPGGALYDAVKGNWKAVNAGGVEILGIDGVDLPSFSSANYYGYWSLWENGEYATKGACEEEASPGEDIVFAVQCEGNGPFCPGDPSTPEHFLTSGRPTAESGRVGEAVSVTIGSRSTATGGVEATLPAGVTVGATDGNQTVTQTPDAAGVATFTFSAPGTYTLQARGPDSIPSDPETVTVVGEEPVNAAPGSNTPRSGVGGVAGFTQSNLYRGPFAVVAHPTGPLDNHVYRRGNAPRLLAGTILSHVAVTSVSIELRRRDHARCSAFDGQRARFVRARCGSGSFFQVAHAARYSYLLPSALPPGRYVLDVNATDAIGNVTSLARGTSRIVFYVSA